MKRLKSTNRSITASCLVILFYSLLVMGFIPHQRHPFVSTPWIPQIACKDHERHGLGFLFSAAQVQGKGEEIKEENDQERNEEKDLQIILSVDMSQDKITKLFAWIRRVLLGDSQYDNLMMAFAAIFGVNLPSNSPLHMMVDFAMETMQSPKSPTSVFPTAVDTSNGTTAEGSISTMTIPLFQNTKLCGYPHSMQNRQASSLGAMGAGQWTGQFKTRPHALLVVKDMENVTDWIQTLPRGCRRTLKRALNNRNFTVTAKPICNNVPAPHSSLAHFACVVQHEVRLLSGADPGSFFDALGQAIFRYMGTTEQAGVIQEYRNVDNGNVIAFAHEIRKGNVMRGQWFYASNEAAKQYVWFHSVHSLVQRAIDADGVDVVDLGPSGSDEFSALKARYGFESVDDWPAVANYIGPFWCYETEQDIVNGLTI